MPINKLIFIFACFFMSIGLYGQKMNNAKLEKVLKSVTDSVEGKSGYWQIKYFDRYLLIVTDENHNRMRIISPIAEVKDLNNEMIMKSLEANFHSVLDAKYAISDNIMWAAYLHPLKELSEEQVKSAIKEVYSAAATFGYSYTGSDLVFPGSKQK